MADETELERLRRLEQEDACNATLPELSQLTTPQPDTAPCDPAETPVPDVFLPPNTAPATPVPDLNLPGPVVIKSPAVTAECSAGEGTVTHPLGYLTDNLYISDLEEIPRSEIYRTSSEAMIAELQAVMDDHLEDLADGVISEAEFEGYVMAATGLDASAADAIRVAALQIRADLQTVAVSLAESDLRCLFRSQELWVICADDADGYAVVFSDPGSVTKVYRPESFETSYVSVEDANDRAVFDALTDLDCVYLNEPQTVTCPDLDPKFDHTYSPAFAWGGSSYATLEALAGAGFSALTADDVNAGETSTELVYSFTQGPSAAFAASTQAAANERAYAAALASLRCFFPSREGVLDCVNVDPTGEVADRAAYLDTVTADGRVAVFNEMTNGDRADSTPAPPENLGILAGPVLDDSLALIVNKPAGLFISYDTPEDAEELANTYAATFLRCVWLSPPISCACTDTQAGGAYPIHLYTEAELVALKVHVNLDRSSPPATLPFGYTESDTLPITDPEDPESPLWPDLGSLCLASISCAFCNDIIPPRCTIAFPGGVEPGDDLYDPPVDLPLQLAPPSDPVLVVSEDITSGLAADSVCDANPNVVAGFAGSLAEVPPVRLSEGGGPNDGCRFVNAPVTRTCEQKVGGLAYALHSASVGRSITIPAGQFDSVDSPAAATAAALAFANAVLICEFTNPKLKILCGAELPESVVEADYTGPEMTIGTGSVGGAPVHATAIGSTTVPIFVERNFYRSQESPYDAFIQAWVFGSGRLDCFFLSTQTEYCVPKNDTRIRHIDGIYENGFPSIPEDGDGRPIWGGYHDMATKIGQLARFKYEGLQLPGTVYDATLERLVPAYTLNPPGKVVPSAVESAKSYVSQGDADNQASTAALARLDCTHSNWYRDNNRCPQGSRLLRMGIIDNDNFHGVSTETANLEAEMAAIASTLCMPVTPFAMGAFAVPGGDVGVVVMPGGGSAKASALTCAADEPYGAVIRKLYWEDCTTLADYEPYDANGALNAGFAQFVGNGEHLFWIEARCCTGELRFVITHTPDSGIDGDILDPDFFPTIQLKEQQEANTPGEVIFIGALKVAASTAIYTPVSKVWALNQYKSDQFDLQSDSGNRYRPYLMGNRLYVAEGSVSYVQVPTRTTNDSASPVTTTPVFPKIGSTFINAPGGAYFTLTDGSDGTLWLIVQQTRCSGDLGDASIPERIVKTAKGASPTMEEFEHKIRIFDYDYDDGALSNTKRYLEADWVQWYDCDGNFNPSDDSGWGSTSDDSGSFPGSTPSASDEEEEDPNCNVTASAAWVNKVDCFPADPAFTGDIGCVPGPFVFEVRMTFSGKDEYGIDCPHWAYSAHMPGSTSPPCVWLDSRIRTCKFAFDNAPACSTSSVMWRARGYGPIKDGSGNVIPSCCGREFNGTIPVKKLPPVCGCGCSSSGDLDGDGLENNDDNDIDGDGMNNFEDDDMDGDGSPDDIDGDADGDGIPNDDDTTPFGGT